MPPREAQVLLKACQGADALAAWYGINRLAAEALWAEAAELALRQPGATTWATAQSLQATLRNCEAEVRSTLQRWEGSPRGAASEAGERWLRLAAVLALLAASAWFYWPRPPEPPRPLSRGRDLSRHTGP
jgi:hypothetical protein